MNTAASARATLTGIIAILLWSTSVGLLRSLAEHFGPLLSAALVYSTSALFLCLSRGLPRLRAFSRRYLIIGGALFISYETALALAIGLAHSRSQSLELGMINYLWPSLTVVMALWINAQRYSWLLWPGLLLALAGVLRVLGGDNGFSLSGLWQNVQDNPVAYLLALCAAIVWALYCNLTRRWAKGQNAVSLFFCLTALTLWCAVLWQAPNIPHPAFTFTSTLQLLFMGLSTALAYSAWNHGIQQGNMTLLATASYFTPVLSALASSLWLQLTPGFAFWQGVCLVVAGSLLCWRGTQMR
ncbi:aromatic amino acid DMT transporter YddG [Erwinia sp. HR93]|uniref:aromatic amino acid DMT transporter YddG n=1 Tax=Erwinia sp. HR93 TaxID=3094840 RepID=UPI002ADEA75D|nr:aromatic amino acid DMT transporter YddG [Erwinia sp. HR93]MEA1064891.1 aromatic amino acid DMT transporter YddG [Erwinia sp. HR93]